MVGGGVVVLEAGVVNGEVEHIRVAAGLAWRRLRDVVFALAINLELYDWMTNHNFIQINLPPKHGLDFQSDCQFVHLDQRWSSRGFRSVHDNPIEMRREL